MPLVTFRRHLFAAGVVLALTPTLLTAAPAGPEKGKAASPAEKLRADLDQVISIEITEQPLDLALKQLHEQTKLNFVIDRWTIQQMGMQPENMPVTIKLKDVKTKSALRSILTPYQLGYAIIGDTIVVSTEDMAMYKQMRQRVNVDFDKEELSSAMKKMARETATNLIVDSRAAKEAKMEVTLQMEDVPLETAVRLMTEMAGLKPVRVGNVLFITTKANAAELRADPDLIQPAGPRGVNVQEMLLQQGIAVPGVAPAIAPPPAPAPGQPGVGTVPPSAPDPKDEKEKSEKPEKNVEKTEKADKPEKSEKPDNPQKEDKDKAEKPADKAPVPAPEKR